MNSPILPFNKKAEIFFKKHYFLIKIPNYRKLFGFPNGKIHFGDKCCTWFISEFSEKSSVPNQMKTWIQFIIICPINYINFSSKQLFNSFLKYLFLLIAAGLINVLSIVFSDVVATIFQIVIVLLI